MKLDNEVLSELIITYIQRIVLALIVLLIGIKLIKYIKGTVSKSLERHNVDRSLHSFLLSLTNACLLVLLFVTIASMLGIEMTSFVAILGATGLAVGLALQGSLSNFAGGVLILLLKPFKVGDFVEAGGHIGTVADIQVFYTILNTPDNKVVFIPNGQLSNSSTINFSTKDTRRVDVKIGVSYNEDIQKVKSVLNNIINQNEMVLDNPVPFVRLAEYGDSSVNFVIRVWCNSKDFEGVKFDLLESIKIEFDKERINIPYPHLDVNINNNV